MKSEQYMFILGHLFLIVALLYNQKESPLQYLYYTCATVMLIVGIAEMMFRLASK